MDSKIFSKEGKEVGKISLPESVFGVAWNSDLVHEVVLAMQSNARAGTATTKDRGDVRGGGKKPWRQKGTGRARHGSRRSPIWVGGGVAHGPTNEKDFSKKINKKARAKALASTLSKKLTDNEVIFVDSLTFAEPKTAEAKTIINAIAKAADKAELASKTKNSAVVVLSERNENAEKSFQNFGNIAVVQAKDINPVSLLTYKYVIVVNPDESIKTLVSRVGKEETKN